jgi:hypothetical protein
MPDKFEREIEDILSRLDDFPRRGPTDRARNAVSTRIGAFQRGIAVRVAHLSVGQIMLAGILMILVGYFFRSVFPEVWYYVVILGLILFFTSFALSFFGAGRARGSRQVYWRGRPAQSYYPSGPDLAKRIRAWWRRRQGRRY